MDELGLGLKCVKCGEPVKTEPSQHYHVGAYPVHLKKASRWPDGTLQGMYKDSNRGWAYCDTCYHDEQDIGNRQRGIHDSEPKKSTEAEP